MARAKVVTDQDGRYMGVQILCPACLWYGSNDPSPHHLETDWTPPGMARSPHIRPDVWTFNGDLERPVFGPSLLTWHGNRGTPSYRCCHSFIGCNGAEPGQITFLGDCTHALAGQTVDLPEFPGA